MTQQTKARWLPPSPTKTRWKAARFVLWLSIFVAIFPLLRQTKTGGLSSLLNSNAPLVFHYLEKQKHQTTLNSSHSNLINIDTSNKGKLILTATQGTSNEGNSESGPVVVVPPQSFLLGNFKHHSALPYISADCWMELVDNNRTFFLRPGEASFPDPKTLRDFIASRPHPINIVMNNNMVTPWPANLSRAQDYEIWLNETNLNRIYSKNIRRMPAYPKVRPLPNGPKWQYKSRKLYGEPKHQIKAILMNVSKSPEESEALFRSGNRTHTVWVRPMGNTGGGAGVNYVIENQAMKNNRMRMCDILKATVAPESLVCTKDKIGVSEYFEQLKVHRFVIVALGNGLDTHSTWEALLAGCIPILPKSSLDPMFADLPVWLVEDWGEVTDAKMKIVDKEMKKRSFKWDMAFASGWKKEIYTGV